MAEASQVWPGKAIDESEPVKGSATQWPGRVVDEPQALDKLVGSDVNRSQAIGESRHLFGHISKGMVNIATAPYRVFQEGGPAQEATQRLEEQGYHSPFKVKP